MNRDQLRNPTLGNRVWATYLYPFSRCNLLTHFDFGAARIFTILDLIELSPLSFKTFVEYS